MSQYGAFNIRGGSSPVNTLTGNTGGAVPPDGSGNINVVGSGVVSVAGNPGTHTLTVSVSGAVATAYATDSGTAVPSGGVLTVHGTGGVTTSGSGSTVTIDGSGVTASISITGDTGGALTGSAFTFTGGTTGLKFNGAGTTETLGGTLVVPNGGTGATSLTAHSLLLGQGTSAITALGAATNGQIAIGSTGADPVLAVPSNGNNISWSTGAGSLTANVTGTTQHSVQVGAASGALTSLAVGSTGTVLIGSTGADPAFGGLGVNSGLTNHGVVVAQGNSAFVATAVGTTGQVLTGVTGADPVWASPAASSISITGDTGGALTGNAFTFTGGATGLSFGGSGTTETLSGTLVVSNGGTGLSSVTSHNLMIGNGTSAITLLAPSATSGVPLISQGSASNPAYGTVVVAGGGTGLTSITAHDLMIGNGTSAVTLLAPSATSGVALISQGSSSNPAYGTVVVAGGGTGLTSITAHDLIVGNGTSAVTLLAPSATSGVPLISQGASSDPAYGTAVVAGGGTGSTSFTAYSVICGGTTSTGALQNVVGVGTSGQVLTSNGASALPTWQPASGGGGISTLNGNSGSATGSTVTVQADTTQGTSRFTGSGSTLTLAFTGANNNTYIGANGAGGSSSASGSTAFGDGALAIQTGAASYNSCVGYQAGTAITSGIKNMAFGTFSLFGTATGSRNVGIGYAAGSLSDASDNICIGNQSGSSLGTGGNNINIANVGSGSDSGAMRIGTAGTQTSTYISGIFGVTTISLTTSAVLVSSGDQLGTVVSSRKFKSNIEDMGDRSSSILKLRPVNFSFKQDKTDYRQWGLIAEEVAEVFPDIVNFDKDGLPEAVRYHDMPAILLNELIKLTKRISLLEEQLAKRI